MEAGNRRMNELCAGKVARKKSLQKFLFGFLLFFFNNKGGGRCWPLAGSCELPFIRSIRSCAVLNLLPTV